MSTCLSELALDDVVLSDHGEAPAEAMAHLRTCPACQRRREERLAFVDQFDRLQAGPFWKEVRRRYEARRRNRRVLAIALPSLLAAACATVLLALPGAQSPAGSYLGAKGAASVEIHCRRAGRIFALGPEDSVQGGDELRFVPRPALATARFVQLASIDGTGRYTPFYPSERRAASLPLPPPGEPLGGSIRLDAAPGPERLFYVFSSVPLPALEVEQVARERVTDLRAVTDIEGAKVESGWIVLPKTTAVPGDP
jgi:hypothetical protein